MLDKIIENKKECPLGLRNRIDFKSIAENVKLSPALLAMIAAGVLMSCGDGGYDRGNDNGGNNDGNGGNGGYQGPQNPGNPSTPSNPSNPSNPSTPSNPVVYSDSQLQDMVREYINTCVLTHTHPTPSDHARCVFSSVGENKYLGDHRFLDKAVFFRAQFGYDKNDRPENLTDVRTFVRDLRDVESNVSRTAFRHLKDEGRNVLIFGTPGGTKVEPGGAQVITDIDGNEIDIWM